MDASENFWKVMTHAGIIYDDAEQRVATLYFWATAFNIEGDEIQVADCSPDHHAVVCEALKVAEAQGLPLHDYAPRQLQEIVDAMVTEGHA